MQPRKSLEYGEYDINDNDTKDNIDYYIENEEDVEDDEFSNTIKVFDQNPTASQETIIDDYMEYGKYFLGCMFLSLGFCPVILLLNLVCNSVNIILVNTRNQNFLSDFQVKKGLNLNFTNIQ